MRRGARRSRTRPPRRTRARGASASGRRSHAGPRRRCDRGSSRTRRRPQRHPPHRGSPRRAASCSACRPCLVQPAEDGDALVERLSGDEPPCPEAHAVLLHDSLESRRCSAARRIAEREIDVIVGTREASQTRLVECDGEGVADVHDRVVARKAGPGFTIRVLPIVSSPRDSWMCPQRTRSGCSRSMNARSDGLPTGSPERRRSHAVAWGERAGRRRAPGGWPARAWPASARRPSSSSGSSCGVESGVGPQAETPCKPDAVAEHDAAPVERDAELDEPSVDRRRVHVPRDREQKRCERAPRLDRALDLVRRARVRQIAADDEGVHRADLLDRGRTASKRAWTSTRYAILISKGPPGAAKS